MLQNFELNSNDEELSLEFVENVILYSNLLNRDCIFVYRVFEKIKFLVIQDFLGVIIDHEVFRPFGLLKKVFLRVENIRDFFLAKTASRDKSPERHLGDRIECDRKFLKSTGNFDNSKVLINVIENFL